MNFKKSFRNTFLVILLSLIVSACATKKTTTTVEGQMQGDVYTGTDTVKYLADGVPDRVFFATNESILTTKSNDKGEGFSAKLWSIDLTGYNERQVQTETDASDPSWSSLLSN